MMMTMMVFSALCGMVVLSVAALVTLRSGGASASARHLVWTVALGTLVTIPLLEFSGLRIEVPVPGGWVQRAATATSVEGPAGGLPSAASTDMADAPASTSSSIAHRTLPNAAAPAGSRVENAPPRLRDVEAAPVDHGESGWAGTLVVLWGLGALALLAKGLVSHFRAYRLTVQGSERASPRASRTFAACGLDLGVRRPVRLVVSPHIDVPATWGLIRSTVVLPAHHDEWSQDTLERVLLHELAHVRRGDCRSYLVGEVARALHWPNPLAWLALRRQREESECACDDLVLARGDAPSSYAQDLVRLMRELKPAPLPRPLLTMTGSSGLGRRVRAILDPHQARGGVGIGTVAAATAVAMVFTVAMTVLAPIATAQGRPAATDELPSMGELPSPDELPRTDELPSTDERPRTRGLPSMEEMARNELAVAREQPRTQELCVFRNEGSRSTNISMSSDNDVRIRWETDACRVDVEVDGEMEFLPDDSGIESMVAGAVFEIEERFGRASRRARFEGGPGGRVVRRYWVDGSEVEWSADADRWFAAIVPELFRHTTINAPVRVRRMVAEGGPQRVFDEVARMHSEHVAFHYLRLLVESTDLDDGQYVRVIELAGRSGSDHSAGELLLAVVERAGLRPAFQEPLLRVAAGLGSDHQKARVLEVLLSMDLTAEQLDAVVASTRSIGSDHNASTVLSAVARSTRSREIDRIAFLDALAQIGSDHNKGSVINTFLDAGPFDDAEVVRVLEMTETIGSDHTRGSILQRIIELHELDGAELRRVVETASAIDSDHQLATVLTQIANGRALDRDGVATVLDAASGISSDHQQASVMVSLARRHQIEGDARTLYLELADRMSRHQAEQVRAALSR